MFLNCFLFCLEFLHIKSKIVLLEYLSATRYSTFDILLPEFHFLLTAVAAYLKKILLFKSNHCLNQTFNLFLLLCSPAFLFDFAKNKKKIEYESKRMKTFIVLLFNGSILFMLIFDLHFIPFPRLFICLTTKICTACTVYTQCCGIIKGPKHWPSHSKLFYIVVVFGVFGVFLCEFSNVIDVEVYDKISMVIIIDTISWSGVFCYQINGIHLNIERKTVCVNFSFKFTTTKKKIKNKNTINKETFNAMRYIQIVRKWKMKSQKMWGMLEEKWKYIFK